MLLQCIGVGTKVPNEYSDYFCAKGSDKHMTIQELEQVIALHGNEIYSFCRSLTGNKILADELYQDSFCKVMEQLDRLQADGNIKSYLLSVALRLWRNQKRKSAWRNRIAPMEGLWEETVKDGQEGSEDVLQEVLRQERCQAVRQAVSLLKDRYKIPVLLYYMEEMSVSQIAKIMGIPPGTVKSRLHKARKQLESELEGLV